MDKFRIRKLKYCKGDKVMVSMRLPDTLMRELKVLSDDQHKDVTTIVMEALDEYLEWLRKQG